MKSPHAFLPALVAAAALQSCAGREAPDARTDPATTPPAAARYESAGVAATTAEGAGKAAADPETIAALKQLVTSGQGEPAAAAGLGAGPAAAAAAGAPEGALATAGGPLAVADIELTPPPSWRFVHPKSQMRRAQYQIPGESGPGEAVVYFFGTGQGGSVEDNVSRWLAQFTPAADAAPEPKPRENREAGGVAVTVVRIRGTYDPGSSMGVAGQPMAGQALVGLILESAGGPVFVKITGPAPTIDAAAAAIDQLVASVRLKN